METNTIDNLVIDYKTYCSHWDSNLKFFDVKIVSLSNECDQISNQCKNIALYYLSIAQKSLIGK